MNASGTEGRSAVMTMQKYQTMHLHGAMGTMGPIWAHWAHGAHGDHGPRGTKPQAGRPAAAAGGSGCGRPALHLNFAPAVIGAFFQRNETHLFRALTNASGLQLACKCAGQWLGNDAEKAGSGPKWLGNGFTGSAFSGMYTDVITNHRILVSFTKKSHVYEETCHMKLCAEIHRVAWKLACQTGFTGKRQPSHSHSAWNLLANRYDK